MHSVKDYLLTTCSVLGTRSREKDSSPQRTHCPAQEIVKWRDNDSPHWERHRLQEAQGRNPHLVWIRVKEVSEGFPEEVALKL